MESCACLRNVSKILSKTCPKDKSNLQHSVNLGSDIDRKGQDSVDQGTIHVCSGGPKFSERYWSQTPKIWWSRYQSSIGICWGPFLLHLLFWACVVPNIIGLTCIREVGMHVRFPNALLLSPWFTLPVLLVEYRTIPHGPWSIVHHDGWGRCALCAKQNTNQENPNMLKSTDMSLCPLVLSRSCLN